MHPLTTFEYFLKRSLLISSRLNSSPIDILSNKAEFMTVIKNLFILLLLLGRGQNQVTFFSEVIQDDKQHRLFWFWKLTLISKCLLYIQYVWDYNFFPHFYNISFMLRRERTLVQLVHFRQKETTYEQG